MYSSGAKTNRDSWLYSFSEAAVTANASQMVSFFNRQVDEARVAGPEWLRDNDPEKFSWNRADESRLRRGVALTESSAIRVAAYRPFMPQHLVFDGRFIDMIYRLPQLFAGENWGFYLTAPGSGHDFSVLMTATPPDVAFWGSGSGQYFPRYDFETRPNDVNQLADFEVHDSITRQTT